MPLMLSPGPANLVSFALAARFGLSRLLSFIFGVSLVYIFVALALGVGVDHLAEQYSDLAVFIRLFGGVFIVYLGIQLLTRKHRNETLKTPNMWSGIALQLLNPKYPPVVLAVFSSSQSQNVLITAGILTFIGVAGLLIYAATGAIIRHHVDQERQFGKVDVVFGVLLCFVGVWLIIEPLPN